MPIAILIKDILSAHALLVNKQINTQILKFNFLMK